MIRLPVLSRFLHVALFENWLLKFICLALAVLIWFYIDGELTDHRDFAITVRASDLHLPAGLELVANLPLPKFSVHVRGPRRRLQLVSSETIGFKKVSMEDPQPGHNVLDIKPADIKAEGLEVISVTPDDNEPFVELVATSSCFKPVRVKARVEARTGYLVEKSTSVPSQVKIEGPTADLDKIDYVWTEEVVMSNADREVVQIVSIETFRDIGGRRILFRCSEKVQAIIPVHPPEVTRRLFFDIQTLALPGTAMVVSPKSVEVEVSTEIPDLTEPELRSNVRLFVEWPRTWEKPKDEATVLGPLPVQVQVFSPSRIQVRGIKDGILPTVEVRGALAGAL